MFAAIFAEAGRPVPVTIVPNANHIGLTLQRQAISVVVSAIDGATALSAGDQAADARDDPATSPT
jgi:hypothetical protein